jgi:uncharacterized repeat protein (TIGR01451 family)
MSRRGPVKKALVSRSGAELRISEVQVTLADGPDPLNVGEALTYTAVVTNIQDDSAQKVVLSVVRPMGVTYSSGSSDANNGAAVRTWVNP